MIGKPMASTSSSVSGRPLRDQAREIVYNVAQFFKSQKEVFHIPNVNVIEMISEATGVSDYLVKKVIKKGK